MSDTQENYSDQHRQLDFCISRPDNGEIASVNYESAQCVCYCHWPPDDVLQQWHRLWSTALDTSPFQSPLWQHATFLHRQLKRPRILCVYVANKLIGILPLRISSDGDIENPDPCITDYLNPLVHPDYQELFWKAILNFLNARWDDGVRRIQLHNLPATADCRNWIPALAHQFGFQCMEETNYPVNCIELPDSWQGYLEKSMNAHQRKEIRRKLKNIANAGKVDWFTVDDKVISTEKIKAELEISLALMENATGLKASDTADTLRPLFQHCGVALIQAGAMHLKCLNINETPAARLFQFATQKGPQAYNCGINPNFRQYSPGIIAFTMAIKDAIEQTQSNIYDLLRGGDVYKQRLGAVEQPTFRLVLVARN